MLVLTRKLHERIVVADHIVIEVVSVQNGRVRLGISAPGDVSIMRDELLRPDVTVPGPEIVMQPTL